MWYIKGTSPDGINETIDECKTESEAEFLVQEYNMAFRDWVVWHEGNQSYSPFDDTIEHHQRFV